MSLATTCWICKWFATRTEARWFSNYGIRQQRNSKIQPSADTMKLMSRTTVRAKGRLTLPTDIRRAARLEEGDILEAEITTEGILLRPQRLIDATQAWFWSPSWRAAEREADADHKAGRIDTFASGEEMIDSLQNLQSRSACE